jgi:HEAT repeat protein
MYRLLLGACSVVLTLTLYTAFSAQVVTPPTSFGKWPPIESPQGVDSVKWDRQDVPFLVRELRQTDSLTQVRAASALRSFGPATREATPLLRKLLHSEDARVRLESACALLIIDPAERPAALPVILATLKDPDQRIRLQSVSRLCLLGNNARDAGPAVANALRDEDEAVREAISQALTKIPVDKSKVIPSLLGLLDHSSADVKKSAIHHMGLLGRDSDEQVRRGLTQRLTDRDEKVRLAAAMALHRLHSDDKRVKESILEVLKSKNWENRMECAAFVLANLHGHQDAVFEAFALGVKDDNENEDVLGGTIWRICSIAETDNSALTYLERLAKNKDGDTEVRTRALALAALRTLASRAKVVIPTLIPCLPEDYPIGGHAADALGAMRKAAQQAIPELEKVVCRHEKDRLIDLNSYDAAAALIKIDSNNAVATRYLLGLIRRPFNSEARIKGVSAFFGTDPLPHAAVADLVRMAKTDRIGTVRRLGVMVLRQSSEGDRKDAVLGIIPALHDPEPSVREAAAESLGQLGADSISVSRQLEKLFSDEVLDVRLAAILAHRKILDCSPRSAKALVELLGDRKAQIREEAAISLARLGDDASESLPVLTRLLTDPDPRVSMAGRYAVHRIRKEKNKTTR